VRAIRETIVLRGFLAPVIDGLPCCLRKGITMAQTRVRPRGNPAGVGEATISLETRAGSYPLRPGNEGVGEHVRTRSHVGQGSLT
jgi:hypothetical protein